MMPSKSESAKLILAKLRYQYKDARCALDHGSPYQLLIATILSAQCTDERVNKVTPALFKEFPNENQMAVAKLERVEQLVHSTGFFKNKAKNIISCSQKLVASFDGKIPLTMEEMIQLPGVGRKTANVVLGNAFNISSGVVVDTHVLRLSNRFGWVRTQNPEVAEARLMKLVPQKDWIKFPHWMIFHGREVCVARAPKCLTCFIRDLCPRKGLN
jgi:endonuclease-3